MKRAIKLLGRGALAILVLLAILVGWAYTFEDEIKGRVLAELQSGLTSDMTVGSIEYRVLRSFPYASLECRQIVLMGSLADNDTLVRAEALSFDIGLIALIQGDITFRSITLSNGQLNLRRDAKGAGNHQIWKSDTAAVERDSAFDIERLILDDVSVSYDDRMSDVRVTTRSTKARIAGSLDNDVFEFEGELNTSSLYVEAGSTVWVDGASVSGSLSALLDMENQQYSFTGVEMDVSGIGIGGELRVTSAQKTQITANIEIRSTDLNAARNLIPKPYRSVLDGYALDGSATGRLELAGFSDALLWGLSCELQGCALEHLDSGAQLDKVKGRIAVLGGGERTGQLRIESAEARLGSGRIVVEGSVNDFHEPTMQLSMEGELRLEELLRLAGASETMRAEGRVAVELGFAGRWPVVQSDSTSTIDPTLLRQSRYNGVAELSGVSFATQEMPRAVEELYGRVNFEGDYATVNELRLRLGESDLRVSGTLKNVLPWVLTQNEVLVVEARSQSRRIDLNGLLAAEDQPSTEEAYAFVLPNDLDLHLDASVDELTFRNFTATAISGSVSLNRSGLRINPVRFNTCDGQAALELAVTPSGRGFRVTSAGLLSSINIRKLFFAFEEFGQEFITSTNLRGTCKVDAVFSASMSETLQLDPRSIVSSIDLTVENGELIGLQSLADISAYMRANKLISPFIEVDRLEDSMRHIRFETLENRIEIKDERIYFPMMDIKSSALDIKASGSHWFDNRIDYSVGLYLRDILVRKERREFGEVEDDGLGSRFFLSMKGSVDDPEFGYDRDAKKELRKEERRQERETLKQILKEELNPFRKRDDGEKDEGGSGGSSTTITIDWGDGKTTGKPKEGTSTSTTEKNPQDSTKRRWRIGGSDKDEKVAPPPDDDDDDF